MLTSSSMPGGRRADERRDESPAADGHAAGATRAVQKVLDFIDAGFAEPISLADLADVAGLSVSRFAARFSREVGVSPQQYVRLVRVRHAQCLLQRGLSPSLVAAEVGFFDQSHLCRHFKRVLGRTPVQWLNAGD
ncbi:helix-turn-helix domain-containing protein [Paraburkholderia sp. J67]|uniref:helix-turn-helix domain-containing protein n=1 Tax=Paraburkholderia sp. J67 TaxID=2805435 RepID=UPI0039F533D6